MAALCLRCGESLDDGAKTFCSERCRNLWLAVYGPDGEGVLGRVRSLPDYDPEEEAFGGYEEDLLPEIRASLSRREDVSYDRDSGFSVVDDNEN